MPTVPRYTEGQVQATVQPDVRQSDYGANVDDFGGGLGRGLQRIGEAVGLIVRKEQDQRAEDALLGYDAETTDAQTEVLHGEAGALQLRGEQAIRAVDPTIAEWDKRERAALEKVPAWARKRAEALGVQRRAGLRRSLAVHALREQEVYSNGQAEANLDAATNAIGLGLGHPDQVALGLASIEQATRARWRGASAEQLSEAVRQNASRAIYSGLQRVLAGDGVGPARAALERYGSLVSADHLTMFETHLTNAEQQLATRAAAAAEKREAAGEKAVTMVNDAASTGIPMTPEALLQWSAQASGTSSEPAFAAAVGRMQEVQQVRRLPFAQQRQYIAALEAQLHQGVADPKREKTRLDTLTSALAANRKLANDAPVLFWQLVSGEQSEPIRFGLGAPGIELALAGRFNTLQAMRKQFGEDVSLNPFRPEEAEELRRYLARPETSIEKRLELVAAIGKVAPDANAFRAALKPIELTDRTLYVAAHEQFLKHEAEKNGPIAPLILHGARVLAEKTIAMPSDDKFLAAFDEDVGEAIPTGTRAREDALLKYRTLYAALIEKIPRSQLDKADGELEDELRDTALQLATGGIIDYNGRKTPTPWGYRGDAETFARVLRPGLEAAAKMTGYSADALAKMPLQQLPNSPNEYFLLNAGRIQTNASTGQPVRIVFPGTAP